MFKNTLYKFYKLGTTPEQYTTNQLYKQFILPKNYFPYQFDGYLEKKHYGLKNNKGKLIFPKETSLKNYKNLIGAYQQNINFVVDAYNDMNLYHTKLFETNKIQKNYSIYMSLNPVQSYRDPDSYYIEHLNAVFNYFLNVGISNQKVKYIKNINLFMNYLTDFMYFILNFTPINRSQFLISQQCPLQINGLVIDFLAPETEISDVEKVETFLNDANFEVFLESARRFGFFVDRNNPWRIISDLESPITKNYYFNYGFRSLEEVFAGCYNLAENNDIDTLINTLVALWNGYVVQQTTNAETKEITGCKDLFTTITTLEQVTVENFIYNFGIEWVIRFYLFSRILESNLKIEQKTFEIIFSEAVRINNFIGQNNAVAYINEKISSLIERNKIFENRLTTEEDFSILLEDRVKFLKQQTIVF